MTRIARLFACGVIVCAMALPVRAQEGLGKRVSLDFKAMAPAEAFKVLADAIGTKVTVDPAVTTPVDILVRNVSARTVLTTICESIGCNWTAGPAGQGSVGAKGGSGRAMRLGLITRDQAGVDRLRALLKQPLPQGMKFENASLADVSARLSEALKSQVEIGCNDPAVQTVTADVSGMTVMAALNLLTDQPQKRATIWRLTIRGADGQTRTVRLMISGAKRKAPRDR
jgi:hypothetical protein